MHMVYMARAYPGFKTELQAAIIEGSADEAGKAMLLNIQFLCEFAIPAVFLPSCVYSERVDPLRTDTRQTPSTYTHRFRPCIV